MAIDWTFGKDEKELAPGVVELRDGMEVFRADPSDDVWYSYEVINCSGVFKFYVNPKPEQIQPHWQRPDQR